MAKVITTELQHSGASGANVTLDSSKNVTCENNLTVDGNLTVTGTNNVGAGGATGTDYNDNVKVRFGTGNDLEIYHNGTNSFLTNSTGHLYIKGADGHIYFRTKNDTENGMLIQADGAVELYHDNNKRFETTAAGATVTGNLAVSDGIDFSADGNNGGMSSEVLDDYEEGVYTATVACQNGSMSLHADHNTVAYTKIGRLVHIQGRVRFDDMSGQSGWWHISLPFSVITGLDEWSEWGMSAINTHDINLSTNSLGSFLEFTGNANDAYITEQFDNAAWAALNASNLKNNDNEYFMFSAQYLTSS